MDTTCTKDSHQWSMTNEDFIEQATQWHTDGAAPAGHFYVSRFVVHYWETIECSQCGMQKLLSAVLDKPGEPPIPDEEFTWLSLFITQLNLEIGYIEQKKLLINDSLDQMHWAHFPYVAMHNPDDNYFSISYKDDHFLRYDWNFYDALQMFKEMNERAQQFLAPQHAQFLGEHMHKLEELKHKYQTLMELASQAGMDGELERERESLYKEFKQLSDELKDLI